MTVARNNEEETAMPLNTINENEWESGGFGKDEEHVRRSDPKREESLDDALGLQPISIRMSKELLGQLKFIAKYRGVGYQPLIRDVLCRWTRMEVFAIAEEMQKELQDATTARKRA